MAGKITLSGKNESLVKRFDGFARSVRSQSILVKQPSARVNVQDTRNNCKTRRSVSWIIAIVAAV
jgi:hypothetical protein